MRVLPARVSASLALMLLLPGTPSHAGDFQLFGQTVSFTGTNIFEYTYFLDNDGNEDPDGEHDDRYHQLFDTIDLNLGVGDVRLGARLDLYVFGARPFGRWCDGQPGEPGWCRQQGARFVDQYLLYRKQAIMPERLFLAVARPELDLTLGDFYVSLGKGLALNIVKVDALGQDTAVRGGKLALHHADFGLTFVAGEINPLDIDNATGKVAAWPIEPLIAGQVEYRFFERLLAGAHAVMVISDNDLCRKSRPDEQVFAACDRARTDHNVVWGGRLEAADLLGGRLSVAAEADLQRTVELGEVVRGPDRVDGGPFAGDRGSGLALYATSTLQLGELSLLAEFKRYDDFSLGAPEGADEPYRLLYHQPPTLERVKAEVTDNRTVTGGRLRVEYALSDDLVLSANYGLFDTGRVGIGNHRVHDPYAGLELGWGGGDGHLNLTTGARHESDEDLDQLYRLDVHADLDIEQALFGTHSVKLSAFYQYRSKRLSGLRHWHELDSALEYKWSPHLAAALTVELQSDPAAARVDSGGAQVYLGGSARYFFSASSYVGVRVGQNRGGIKCLNGTCRLFPPFAGLQLFATTRW